MFQLCPFVSIFISLRFNSFDSFNPFDPFNPFNPFDPFDPFNFSDCYSPAPSGLLNNVDIIHILINAIDKYEYSLYYLQSYSLDGIAFCV